LLLSQQITLSPRSRTHSMTVPSRTKQREHKRKRKERSPVFFSPFFFSPSFPIDEQDKNKERTAKRAASNRTRYQQILTNPEVLEKKRERDRESKAKKRVNQKVHNKAPPLSLHLLALSPFTSPCLSPLLAHFHHRFKLGMQNQREHAAKFKLRLANNRTKTPVSCQAS